MMTRFPVNGYCAPEFSAVKEVFASNLDSGDDVGASFAVSYRGEMVVDLWGGFQEPEKTQEWLRDTIVNVYSTTKTVTTICLLVLVDRGLIDLDTPVSRYWPEFAVNGKESLPVRYLLSHSSGLAGWDETVTVADLFDWEKATGLLAAQAPWWEPGTRSGYHAVTYGFLLGEIVRRVTGKTPGDFLETEIAHTLGADFHIGVDEEDDHRVAFLIPPSTTPQNQNGNAHHLYTERASIPHRVFSNPVVTPSALRNRKWRAAEIPAINGHGNARSVVKINSLLANAGEFEGTKLLSTETIKKVMTEQCYGPDLVLFTPVRWGLGFALTSKEMPVGVNPNTLWWGGYGGSRVVIDPDARLCGSYVMNRIQEGLTGDFRSSRLIAALYQGIASSK